MNTTVMVMLNICNTNCIVPMAASSTPSRFLDGPLFKRGKLVKSWKYRWFVLDRHAGLLSYYKVIPPEASCACILACEHASHWCRFYWVAC